MERVLVDGAEFMRPKALRKHINLRHIPAGDYRSEHERQGQVVVYDLTKLSMEKSALRDSAVIRAYHERCHQVDGDRYDHEHVT